MTSPWHSDQNQAPAPADGPGSAGASGTPGGPERPGAPPEGPGGPGLTYGFGPGPAKAPVDWWAKSKGDVIVGAVTAAACLVAAVAVGIIWHAVAPEIPKIIVNHNDYLRPSAQPESEIARDGWFAIIGVIAGLLLAGLAFWRGGKYGIGVAVGLGLGGLLGAYVAYKIGAALGPEYFADHYIKREGRIEYDEPLRIQAKGVLYLWPMASLILFACLSAGFGPRDPVRKNLRWAPGVNWAPGQPAPYGTAHGAHPGNPHGAPQAGAPGAGAPHAGTRQPGAPQADPVAAPGSDGTSGDAPHPPDPTKREE